MQFICVTVHQTAGRRAIHQNPASSMHLTRRESIVGISPHVLRTCTVVIVVLKRPWVSAKLEENELGTQCFRALCPVFHNVKTRRAGIVFYFFSILFIPCSVRLFIMTLLFIVLFAYRVFENFTRNSNGLFFHPRMNYNLKVIWMLMGEVQRRLALSYQNNG